MTIWYGYNKLWKVHTWMGLGVGNVSSSFHGLLVKWRVLKYKIWFDFCFAFAGNLQGSRIHLKGIFQRLSLSQVLKLQTLAPHRLLLLRQQPISIDRTHYFQERHRKTLTKSSSTSFKSASSCWARWVRMLWRTLFASNASCASCFVDFISSAWNSGCLGRSESSLSEPITQSSNQKPRRLEVHWYSRKQNIGTWFSSSVTIANWSRFLTPFEKPWGTPVPNV